MFFFKFLFKDFHYAKYNLIFYFFILTLSRFWVSRIEQEIISLVSFIYLFFLISSLLEAVIVEAFFKIIIKDSDASIFLILERNSFF